MKNIEVLNKEVVENLKEEVVVKAILDLEALKIALAKTVNGDYDVDLVVDRIANILVSIDFVREYLDISYESLDSKYIEVLDIINNVVGGNK